MLTVISDSYYIDHYSSTPYLIKQYTQNIDLLNMKCNSFHIIKSTYLPALNLVNKTDSTSLIFVQTQGGEIIKEIFQ